MLPKYETDLLILKTRAIDNLVSGVTILLMCS